MKYKIGDKVRIKSKEWYEKNKNEKGSVLLSDRYSFWDNMKEILGRTFEIKMVDNVARCYVASGTLYYITDEMIEGLVSDEKPLISTELIKDIANVIKTHNLGVSISENEGKLIIEPLKVEEEKDLPVDTPVMCKDKSCSYWVLRYYSHKGRVFVNGDKSDCEDKTAKFDYTIPCSQFNFENPEESLKYNIVK